MGHDPINRLDGQEKLQMRCYLLHHKGGYRAGNIYLCAEEPARQALINMVVACSDVSRVMNRSVALIAVNNPGEVIECMDMKRSKQQHRHIDQQHNPGEQPLPASDAVM